MSGSLCQLECRCQNGGTCGGNREQCDCPSGYSGVICETCSRECQNGGTLNSDECSCICVEGFAGDNCEIGNTDNKSTLNACYIVANLTRNSSGTRSHTHKTTPSHAPAL